MWGCGEGGVAVLVSLDNVCVAPHPSACTRPPRHLPPSRAAAVITTGLIWARWSTQITPVNWNLCIVNAVMASTGLWHAGRMIHAKVYPTRLEPVEADLD